MDGVYDTITQVLASIGLFAKNRPSPSFARHMAMAPESAQEKATAKFARRFRAVEAGAKAKGKNLKDMTLEEMDALWDEAKRSES